MYVCVCGLVDMEAFMAALRTTTDLDDLLQITGASQDCGLCLPRIISLWDSYGLQE